MDSPRIPARQEAPNKGRPSMPKIEKCLHIKKGLVAANFNVACDNDDISSEK